MMFETLTNELLLELFQYFNISQLFHAFQSLNSRFNNLLFIYLQNFHYLNLYSISKHDFNFICQYYLQSITKQILSLILSNDDETPQQIQLFFSHGFNLRQFTHLQSLSLHKIHSYMIIREILITLPHLWNLIRLKFIDCCLSSLHDEYYLIDNIWKLPKLIHLQLHDFSNERNQFFIPQSISSSIEYISIKNSFVNIGDIYHLLTRTPHLRHAKVYLNLHDEIVSIVEVFPMIMIFELYDEHFHPSNIDFTNHIPRIICLLRSMPNLCNLTIETQFIIMDGYRWKCFIRSFLPKLKIFRLKMSIYFNNFDTIKSRVDYIINSFETQFWIDEHQWFIRCHCNSDDKYSQYILFYTWPYTFSYLSIPNNHQWSRSIYNFNDNHWSSSRVHHLLYNFEHNILSNKIEDYSKFNLTNSSSKLNKIFRFKTKSFSLSDNQSTIIPSSFDKTIQIKSFNSTLIETYPILNFPNIYQLTIELPLDEYFWWIIPKFDRLILLNIKSSTQNINQLHLQKLFDQAPRLYSLIFHFDLIKSNFSLINTKSKSIRRLDFKGNLTYDQCPLFNYEQCIALTHSSLGKQCEVLSIGVQHRRNILFLINTMINLRALNVRCQDDQYGNKTITDDFIHWLKNHLSSTVTIERMISCKHNIRLWIR